jgi:Domain of unknown function (DUF3597)
MGHPQVRWSVQLMTHHGGILAQFQGDREGQRSLTTKFGGMWHYTGELDGSAAMNLWLHKEVMKKLAENGGKVPQELPHSIGFRGKPVALG